MKVLDRYIGGNVAGSFLVALAALLAVFSVINLTQELKDVGSGSYGAGAALLFVALTLPAEAYELFPAAALLGAVLGLGTLATNSELVAMAAGGLSRQRLVRAVLGAAFALMIAAVVLGELVAAPLSMRARSSRSVAVSGGSILSTATGVWARDGSTFVNIRTPREESALGEIYLYHFDGGRRLVRVTYARGASYTPRDGWHLEDLVESRFGDRSVTTERLPDRAWATALRPAELRVLFMPPEELSMLDLYRSIGSLRERGESPRRHEMAFWRRLGRPLMTGLMVLVGIPFVLAAPRGVALGTRVVVAALAGVGFEMAGTTLAQMGLVYAIPPLVAAAVPALVAVAAFLLLMRRTYW
jgi:lipopolysaccharide export system permease protein